MSDPTFEAKTAVYARFGNGTVLRLAQEALPAGGRVLDVGCASGGLLALLDHAGFRAGVEPSRAAATEAEAHADAVHCGGFDDELPWDPASFDLVLLADVIEHLPAPEAAVARAAAFTRPGGTVVVSVPNVAHWKARATIAAGRFPREESGTFDATHLNWFTVPRLLGALTAAGLEGVALHPVVPALRNHVPLVERAPGRVRGRVERGWQVLGRRRPGLLGYQLVATGQRPA